MFAGLDARGCDFPVCAAAFYGAATKCAGAIEDPPAFLACMAADVGFSKSCCGCMVELGGQPQDDCNSFACATAMVASYAACAMFEDPLDWVPCIVGFGGVKAFCEPCICKK